jgi:hypothetical protein
MRFFEDGPPGFDGLVDCRPRDSARFAELSNCKPFCMLILVHVALTWVTVAPSRTFVCLPVTLRSTAYL